MPKRCTYKDCKNPQFSKKLCLYHWKIEYSTPLLAKTPIKRSSKPIKPCSAKKLQDLAKYRKVRDRFLAEHPVCQFPGCSSRQVTCHHSRGRQGALLYYEPHFRSLCWPHHKFCEEHPVEAQRLNLSLKRLDK